MGVVKRKEGGKREEGRGKEKRASLGGDKAVQSGFG